MLQCTVIRMDSNKLRIAIGENHSAYEEQINTKPRLLNLVRLKEHTWWQSTAITEILHNRIVSHTQECSLC